MCGDDDNARMPGMMETTGIGRFIKLSTATVYSIYCKLVRYLYCLLKNIKNHAENWKTL